MVVEEVEVISSVVGVIGAEVVMWLLDRASRISMLKGKSGRLGVALR